jgi:hypothetical protein
MEEQRGSFGSLPYARSCRRIEFDFVELRESTEPGGRLLLVSGVKPWADLNVTLEPLVYTEMPDFWVIEVVGRLTTSGLSGLVDYCAALRLGSIHGRKGIEIVGATKSERKLFPPEGEASSQPADGRLAT